MKKINRVSFLLILLFVLLIGSVFAAEDEFVIIKEYTYQNNKKDDLKSGFVEIFLGSGDFVQYQDDEELTISPIPNEIREDKFGNKCAYFDLTGLKKGAKFNVVVKRKIKAGTYLEDIPARTNTEYIDENNIYLLPQARIDSEDDEIISKAKELTEDMPSDYKKAEAIFKYINVNMTFDESVNIFKDENDEKEINEKKGSIAALKNMKGVCEEFVTLFVAMCRAVNIPSRAIEGYRIQDVEIEVSGEKIKEKELADHVWAEIYLQDFGWVPVEPTVIYTIGSQRVAYLDSFCKIEAPEYVATGIYNYDVPNRTIRNVTEVSFNKKLILADDVILKENKFEDLVDYAWAEKAVQFLYEIDVANGYSETEFKPQNNISRIEFISMLSRALRYKDTMYEDKGLVYYYPDYDQKHWSKDDYDYLMRCYQAITPSDIASAGFYNIVDIFGEGRLNMNKAITRAEVVALMDIFLMDDNTPTKLVDIRGNKFQNSIIKAYNNGIIVGYPDMTFRPNNGITRAEMAVVLERYIGNGIYNIMTGEDNV